MRERNAKILLILVAGWSIGFLHHYFAVKPHMAVLIEEKHELASELHEVKALTSSVKRVKVKTTAYTNDPVSINVARWRDSRTAMNTLARRGVVAADWRVFPPGTRLFIPGYGEAVVEDRGGMVKGYHLDLFVESVQEARRWGVKEIPVYVIEKGRKT
jgi:3D (Asp-Asp-Asp) domain-containing protein